MNYKLFIGLRYLRAKRKQRFISVTTVISVLGVFLGVMSMIVVMAVMTGFEEDLRNKILGTYAHAVVLKSGMGMDGYTEIKKVVEKGLMTALDAEIRSFTFPPLSSLREWINAWLRYRGLEARKKLLTDVQAVTPFTFNQALLSGEGGVVGIVLRGVDPESVGSVTALDSNLKEGSLRDLAGLKGRPGIIIGKELARNLGVFHGDAVTAVSPQGRFSVVGMVPRVKRFTVAGIFESGMYEYDATLAYITIPEAQKFFGLGNRVTGLEIKVRNIEKADKVAGVIQRALGYPYYTRDWKEMNRNLFSALRLEKVVMSLLLVIMILVAAFSIICTLIMMVMEKSSDIAILKSMGASAGNIMTIFLIEGMTIGGFGTLLGMAGGVLVCFLLGTYHFITLPGDVYYITTLPVRMRVQDFIIVAVSAVVMTLLATLYPSYQASRLRPADLLRYE